MKRYFEDIDKELKVAFEVANEARKKGYDPEDKVEILFAKNMAERVEKLISVVAPQIAGTGVVERLKELEKEYGLQDWRVALVIAGEVAEQKFCKFKSEREAMEVGIRVGLAYITNGVVASPLEGFVRLELKERRDGKKYLCLYYSGPIRSAGGTASSVSVIIADYIRIRMGYKEYDPTKEEIKRMSTELYDYHEKVTNLQYLPSVEEIEFMIGHLPVQIDGDPSEKYEVSNYKDLKRIETNIIRNGVCLVVGEGLTQKAPKLWKQLEKWGKDFGLKQWNFLEKFLKIQKRVKAKEKIGEKKEGIITPDYTFIKDLVAGRPVLGHPLRSGAFRLRYGRCRVSGYSSYAIHPATMVVLSKYIAIGTQLRVERPGKATVVGCCDSIEGPVVRLKNGDVVLIENEKQAKEIINDMEEILYLGDILIGYGEFLNRAHVLIPPGYCEEWWMQEAGVDKKEISVDEAIGLCKEGKPLHPRYTFHWREIDKEQLQSLVNWLRQGKIQEKIELPLDYDISLIASKRDPKRVLELLGVPHKVCDKSILIDKEWSKALMFSLGNDLGNLDIMNNEFDDVLDIINNISGVKVRDKSGMFIGARMGRPEKAKMRKMTGSPHILFPVGVEGGRLRCFQSALDKGKIKAQFPIFYCDHCGKDTIYKVCERCGKRTIQLYYCSKCNKLSKKKCHTDLKYKTHIIDINHYFKSALDLLNITHHPELIKGVRGTSNEDRIPEHLAKGILRAIHGLYVNKDGTARYDMTEMVITHFKPKEIGTSIRKLKDMGYDRDIYGNNLESEEQILEIKPQDVILPGSSEKGLDEKADEFLFNVCNFIDDMLVRLYKLKPFYNLNSKKDLIGQLVIGLSPHTSAGIVLRVIGFSKTQGFLAHPYVHAIMRRDCDGDEAGIILLLDALINFSVKYLPAHRGARQDEPLVLTSRIDPKEVDDMVFDMDICWKYPLEFYEACLNYKQPWDIKIEKIGDRLGSDREFENFGFTHSVGDINKGVRCSAYKFIPTMQEKVKGQMDLAEKIRAVDENDVARLVIERHFIRDIKGNLRKFSSQQFRCVNCNEKYRRPPLLGVCLKCGGRIIFTVAEGSVIKYLEPSLSLAEKYDIPVYLKQTLDLTKRRIESVFGKDKYKQEGLRRWF